MASRYGLLAGARVHGLAAAFIRNFSSLYDELHGAGRAPLMMDACCPESDERCTGGAPHRSPASLLRAAHMDEV